MIWILSKRDDLIIASEMLLDAAVMHDSFGPLHPALQLLKKHYGLEN